MPVLRSLLKRIYRRMRRRPVCLQRRQHRGESDSRHRYRPFRSSEGAACRKGLSCKRHDQAAEIVSARSASQFPPATCPPTGIRRNDMEGNQPILRAARCSKSTTADLAKVAEAPDRTYQSQQSQLSHNAEQQSKIEPTNR